MLFELKMTSLGEGVEGEITEIKVKPGDVVKKDQIVLVVATDKVNADVPAEADGIVQEIAVKLKDMVAEGALLMRIETAGDQPAAAPAAAPVAKVETAQAPPIQPKSEPAAPAAAVSAPAGALRSSPLARKRAKELGLNLTDIHPSEGATRISYKDVLEFIQHKMSQSNGSGGGIKHKNLPNFEKFGGVERQPLSRIGQITAENMTYAFNAIPHAWISEKADITKLEQLRQQYKDQVKAAGGNLTTTAILTKVVTMILKKMPQFNASFDHEKNEIIFKKYYNIGIAVDTPRGLLVPVLRNTDQKGLQEISIDLTEISTRTRDGKNKADDLDGGTFTISNIGGIGGTNMMSIVNWPQVAILSITAAQMEAHWNGTAFEPRLMMPMTIAWDHRVINGADAARFLKMLKEHLEEPFASWM